MGRDLVLSGGENVQKILKTGETLVHSETEKTQKTLNIGAEILYFLGGQGPGTNPLQFRLDNNSRTFYWVLAIGGIRAPVGVNKGVAKKSKNKFC